MKTIRQISQNPLVISIITFSVLCLSCSPNGEDFTYSENYKIEGNQNVINLQQRQMNGEEIFRSIYFFEGESVITDMTYFAPIVDMLNNLTPAQQQERETFTNSVVETIQGIDANFFTNFKTDILSDNPYSVENALYNGGQLIKTVMDIIDYGAAEDLANEIKANYDLSNPDELNVLMQDILEMDLNGDYFKGTSPYSETCVAIGIVILLVFAGVGVAVFVSVIVEVINYKPAGSNTNSLLYDEMVLNIIEKY